MNDYEIDSETSDRINASNYDIADILAVIDITLPEPGEQLLTSLGG